MKLACAAALAALLCPTLSWSQPPAAPDPQRLLLARQIFEAQGGVSNMTAAVRGAMAGAAPNLPQQPGTDPEMQKKILAATNETMIKLLPRVIDEMAKVYANNFDEAELKSILAFYQSPAGRVLVAKMPEIGAQSGAAMGKLMPQVQLSVLEGVCASTTCTAPVQARLTQLKQSIPADQRF
jgi:hypothetical protein